jgi:hypothetical protein
VSKRGGGASKCWFSLLELVVSGAYRILWRYDASLTALTPLEKVAFVVKKCCKTIQIWLAQYVT